MILLDSIWLPLRLLGVGGFVFLAFGAACLARMKLGADLPERLLLAFALSYSWILGLSILLPLTGWSVDYAAVLTIAAVLLLVPWRGLRLRVPRPEIDGASAIGLCVALAIIAIATAAWFIEPPIHGDAALDLVSVARFADGGPIHFDNTSLLPHTLATYLVQPYQMALGMIARWSQTDPIIAFQKVRPLLVFLSLTFMYALVRALAPARGEALAAFAVVVVFIGLDITTWDSNSLFPVVHRGGVAAGVCVPALIALTLMATRRESSPERLTRRRVAMWVTPLFLLASICTHALEMYTFLCLAGVSWLLVLTGLDRAGDTRQVWRLAALFGLTLAIYLPVRASALPEFGKFERQLKDELTAEFTKDHPDVWTKVAGPMGQEAGDLLGARIPATTAGVIGVPALALAVWLAPASTALLALSIVPLALMFAIPAGYVALALATSADSVQEATAYFALLGLLALALGIAAVAHAGVASAMRVQSRVQRVAVLILVIGAAFGLGRVTAAGAHLLLDFTRLQPRVAVLLAVALMVAVVYVAMRRRNHVASPLPGRANLLALALVAVVLAVPLAGLGLASNERVDLAAGVRRALAAPSILNWDAYYGVLQETILPRLPVPRTVVDDLRRRLPERQVLVADPRYSCSLAVVVDAYCVNPEHVYGQYYLSARGYQDRYVYSLEGSGGDWHPFFNETWPMEDRERTFLKEYSVNYLLADPGHADLIARKLRALAIPATIESSLDGYVLYRVSPTS